MTFKILLKILPILQQFFQFSLDAKKSYSLYKMIKAFQNELEFYNKEEEKLINKYTKKSNETEQLIFENDENKNNFLIELEKLQNTKIETQISKISISLKSIEEMRLSPQDFYLLENIIDFQEEE